MPLRLSQCSAPAAEPMHLTEAKLHLRLAADAAGAAAYASEDALLSSIISAARSVAETETWRALVLQIWDLYLDAWPNSDEIEIPLPPLRLVEFVHYTNTDGVVNAMPTDDYDVDTSSMYGRVVLGYGKSWPSDTLAPMNPIHIRFRCGYVAPFSVNTSTDTITAANHPFTDGDVVRLSVSGGTLPGGLAALTDYYVRDAIGNTLKLAATAGGAAIDITSAGPGQFFIGEIPAGLMVGMKLVVTDLYEERGDTVIGKFSGEGPAMLPRAASHYFAMESAKRM